MTEFFVQIADDLTDAAGASSFQPGNYRAMQLDACRMAHYRRDIRLLCAQGARVLEVGPGPLATLSVLCLAAGAREVVAVEMVRWAAEAARAALAHDPRARVLHKHTDALGASDVGGDLHFDVLVLS
jgi:predicted nicotinamide N-methyase